MTNATNFLERIMRAIIYLMLFFFALPLSSEERKHGGKAIEVKAEVGTKDGKMVFIPNEFTFERGKYYKLVISNPSPGPHYFASDAFATHIYTRKIEVAGPNGKTLAEIHGAIHDIELSPNSTIEWFFYPMTKGKNLKLYCHKDNHEEMGMVGTINIIGSLSLNK
tara:strand:+ start:117 stop:611 length:495 start_codon:yes stop_codon:yes gene_type:complete